MRIETWFENQNWLQHAPSIRMIVATLLATLRAFTRNDDLRAFLLLILARFFGYAPHVAPALLPLNNIINVAPAVTVAAPINDVEDQAAASVPIHDQEAATVPIHD
ncbi:hypothetical protein ACFE04_017324 [Oxalis oulophora]